MNASPASLIASVHVLTARYDDAELGGSEMVGRVRAGQARASVLEQLAISVGRAEGACYAIGLNDQDIWGPLADTATSL